MPSKSYTSYYVRKESLIINNYSESGRPAPQWASELKSNSGSVSHGGPVPGYRQLIARGDNATSYLNATKTSSKFVNGDLAISTSNPFVSGKRWTIREGEVCGVGTVVPSELPLTPADNQAKMRFTKACLEALQSFEGQVFLGELGETLRMIKNPLSSFRRSIDSYHDSLRRRRKGSQSHRRRVVADTWLEYSFGWKPLFSDIEDGISALRRFSERPIRFRPVKASGEMKVELERVHTPITIGLLTYQFEKLVSFEANVKYYGVVDLTTSGLPVVAEGLGLRFDRFVPTLWELLPYSFLLDYFSNVGDIISSWSYGRTGLRWAAQGTRRKTEETRRASDATCGDTGNPDVTGRTEASTPGSSISSVVHLSRGPYSGNFVPSLELEIPGMASTKWLNLAALASSRRSLRPF